MDKYFYCIFIFLLNNKHLQAYCIAIENINLAYFPKYFPDKQSNMLK